MAIIVFGVGGANTAPAIVGLAAAQPLHRGRRKTSYIERNKDGQNI